MSWLRGELVVITTNYSPCRTTQVFGHISNHYLLLRRYGMCVYWERLFMLLAYTSNPPPVTRLKCCVGEICSVISDQMTEVILVCRRFVESHSREEGPG